MLQNILVPLDGSPLAEQAIPLAARLARATHGSIRLLHVVTVLNDYRSYASNCPALWKKIVEDARHTALAYLANIADRDELQGLDVQLHICAGQPASSILDAVQSSHSDLIVLCSHGYTGLRRWALGSVAEQLARHATVPVLILRNKTDMQEPSSEDEDRSVQVLVALDGSSQAESALLPAVQFATALSAPGQGIIHLVRVIKPFSIKDEQIYEKCDIDIDLREQARYDAECYLQGVKDQLCRDYTIPQPIKIIWSVMENDDIAEELITLAEQHDASPTGKACTLVAMATHGRTGLSHWTMGSITERVLHHTRLPLLVVRPSANGYEEIAYASFEDDIVPTYAGGRD
jgi:nucleotide-binding universal stress UspA family protein